MSSSRRLNLLHEAEDVQLATLRNELQASSLRHSRSTDGAELVAEVKTSSDGQANPAADAAVDTNVLLATELVGDRVADDAGPELAAPQDLTGLPVDRAEITAEAAVEHETT